MKRQNLPLENHTLIAFEMEKASTCISRTPWPAAANTWLVTPASLDDMNI